MFLVIILWAFIGLQFLLFYFIYLFIRHRSNPRKGRKPRYWERLAQSRPWHGLEEAAPVAELSCACSSSLFHRTCTGRIEKPQSCCLVVLSAAVNVSSLFFLEHGEVQRLVQDDVQTDTQNTWWDPFILFTVAHHVVLLASKLFVFMFLSVCVCFCVCVCVCVSVFMLCHTVFCLSITALRAYWGKPLSPHLHFPRELWHSGETERYTTEVSHLPLASLTLHHSQ